MARARGDEYTTAPGNDANDGLTPATPMASIAGILNKYDLEFGDVIYVDTGTYGLTRTSRSATTTRASASRARPAPATRRILNRGNIATNSYAFTLTDADAVTLANLSITGEYEGIFVSSGSTGFTLQNSRVYENANAGVDITDAASSGAVITDNVFYGDASSDNRDQEHGLFTRGLAPTVLRNEAYHYNGRASTASTSRTPASGRSSATTRSTTSRLRHGHPLDGV